VSSRAFYFPIPKGAKTMDYGMIGKREKAKRYAEERKRFLFNKLDVTFHGDNNNHHVAFDSGVFSCDCEFFMTHQRCAHTMALEIMLQGMVPEAV
jgi:hypothetical protein